MADGSEQSGGPGHDGAPVLPLGISNGLRPVRGDYGVASNDRTVATIAWFADSG